MEHDPLQTHRDTNEHFFDDVPAPIPGAEKRATSPIPVLPELAISLGLLVLVFGITYVSIPGAAPAETATELYTTTERIPEPRPAQNAQEAFEHLALTAESAVVWDVRNKRMLFSKNPDEVLPLASVTKLMTALVAYELMDPEERVSISLEALRTEGDSGLRVGESFSMRNLADIVLVGSSNDGAVALGSQIAQSIGAAKNPESLFVQAMNIRADELGLSKTEFKNSTGLDITPTDAGAYGSARDMARLMEHIILTVPDAVALTSLDMTYVPNTNGDVHVVKNTNELAGRVPGLIASKTGYTELAGGNLIVAFDAGLNRPVVISILGSTYNGRFNDALELIRRTQQYTTEY